MGDVSAMSSINRVIEAHGDAIREDYAEMVPASIREQFIGVELLNNVHAIDVVWCFAGGECLTGPSLDIDFLADEYPDCNVEY